MKSLISLPEFVEVLEMRDSDFYDETLPASQMRMSLNTGEMVLGEMVRENNTFGLQEQALDLMGTRLRIPANYLRRCPAELRAENVNHWLEELEDKPLFVRFDRQEIRAILTTRYTPVSNLSLARELVSSPGLRDAVVDFEVSAKRMIARLITHEAVEVKVNDVVKGGITLLNSEVGYSAVEVSSFIYRLVCSNGMVVMDQKERFRRIHTRKVGLLTDEFHESVSTIVNALPSYFERFRETQQIALTEDRYERLLERSGLTESEKEIVGKAWDSTEEKTGFNLINAFTGAANEVEGDSRLKLQQAGGKLLAEFS